MIKIVVGITIVVPKELKKKLIVFIISDHPLLTNNLSIVSWGGQASYLLLG